ncbi:hypothetical protein KUTeg_011094, partial [Tegillarca granosa]
MDNNDAECHQPSKRKRSLSCTIQDTAKVKVQTEDGCLAADVSHHDNAKDVNYPNNILYEKELDTENVNVSNNRFGHGESFEAWHECNETINEERVCRTWYQLSLDPELWRRIDLRRQERVTDSALVTLTSYSDRVTYLDLTDTKELSCEGTMKVAEGCPDLVELQLTQCIKITDNSIIELTVGCPLLEHLILTRCNLTDKSIQEIKKNLKVLDISCFPSTPAAISQVMKNCTLLECINLSLNSFVDDECIEMVAKYGSNLKRLYCVSCSITDQGLEMIGKYSKTIQHLDVRWCENLTVEGVRTVSLTCPSLRYIYLGFRNCDRVKIKAIRELDELYPNIGHLTPKLPLVGLNDGARQQGLTAPDSIHHHDHTSAKNLEMIFLCYRKFV